MLVELLVQWLPTVLLGAAVIYLVSRIRAWLTYCRLVNKIPGRKANMLLGNTWDMMVPHEDAFKAFCDMSEEGGERGIARIWLGHRPWIMLSRFKPIETILSSQIHLDKADTYDLLHEWLGTGLLNSTGAKWHRRRKMLTPSFHFSILTDFMQVIDEQTRLLVAELDKFCETEASGAPGAGRPVDLASYMNLATLDIICLTAMGKSVDALRTKDNAYLKALAVIGEIFFTRCYYPWLRWEWLFRLLPVGKRNAKNLRVLHTFTKQVIADKRALLAKQKAQGEEAQKAQEDAESAALGRKRRLAFMDVLLEGAAANRLSDADIQEEVDTFMFEGHDTTSSAITMVCYLLGCHPDIQTRVQEEIDSVLGDDLERPLTSEDIGGLRYLDSVIKECFRIYPPVPMFARNLTQPLKMDDLTLPANTVIGIMAYLLHRDPAIFPDPERFDPDRFSPDNCVGRHPFAYVPFSAGPRNCIGQKFALMEVKTVVCHLFRHFRLTPEQTDRTKIKFYGEFVLRPVGGLQVRLQRRRAAN